MIQIRNLFKEQREFTSILRNWSLWERKEKVLKWLSQYMSLLNNMMSSSIGICSMNSQNVPLKIKIVSKIYPHQNFYQAGILIWIMFFLIKKSKLFSRSYKTKKYLQMWNLYGSFYLRVCKNRQRVIKKVIVFLFHHWNLKKMINSWFYQAKWE